MATSEGDEPLIELGESLKEAIREWRVQRSTQGFGVRFALVRNIPDPAHPYDIDIVAYAESNVSKAADDADDFIEREPDFRVIFSYIENIDEDKDDMKNVHDALGKLERQWEGIRALRVKLQDAHKRSAKALSDTDEILERSRKARASAERTMALSRRARS